MRLDSFGVLMRFFGRFNPSASHVALLGLRVGGIGISINMSPRPDKLGFKATGAKRNRVLKKKLGFKVKLLVEGIYGKIRY